MATTVDINATIVCIRGELHLYYRLNKRDNTDISLFLISAGMSKVSVRKSKILICGSASTSEMLIRSHEVP